jgi:hypothetical protein
MRYLPVSVPRFIWVLFAVDLALGLAYLGYFLLGHPYEPFAKLIDLDGEANLPTWYSSVLWFSVAYLTWVFAERHVLRSRIRSWFLFALPLVFVLFSLDEVAQLHEHLGVLSDALLPNGTREATVVSHTGLFFLFVGVPFAIVFIGLIGAVRPFLAENPGAFVKLAGGMALFVFAAVGLDALSNFTTDGSLAAAIQVLTEEVTEMIAATIVLWGAYELVSEARPGVG